MKPSLSPLEKFLRKSSRQGALIERLASKHAGKQANRQHNERARARVMMIIMGVLFGPGGAEIESKSGGEGAKKVKARVVFCVRFYMTLE